MNPTIPTSPVDPSMMDLGGFAAFMGIIVFLGLLDVVLKGFALWRAARLEKTVWFVVMFILGTLGILPAIFLIITREEYAKKYGKGTKKK